MTLFDLVCLGMIRRGTADVGLQTTNPAPTGIDGERISSRFNIRLGFSFRTNVEMKRLIVKRSRFRNPTYSLPSPAARRPSQA
jgi:hypothetical protein